MLSSRTFVFRFVAALCLSQGNDVFISGKIDNFNLVFKSFPTLRVPGTRFLPVNHFGGVGIGNYKR